MLPLESICYTLDGSTFRSIYICTRWQHCLFNLCRSMVSLFIKLYTRWQHVSKYIYIYALDGSTAYLICVQIHGQFVYKIVLS